MVRLEEGSCAVLGQTSLSAGGRSFLPETIRRNLRVSFAKLRWLPKVLIAVLCAFLGIESASCPVGFLSMNAFVLGTMAAHYVADLLQSHGVIKNFGNWSEFRCLDLYF